MSAAPARRWYAPWRVVEAAGGLVWRRGGDGTVEVLVAHRPKYDDWTLPKGKLEPGETAEQAALREVEEETGLRARIVRPLGCTEYVDRRGRDKTVCYWVMNAEGGRFTPNDEVDQLRWLTVDEALDLLTYPGDKALLASQPLP